MTHTIDDLLVVASQETPVYVLTDIVSLVSDVRALFADEDAITIRAAGEVMISCSETLMRSVLRNLLENAVKYRDPGTEIIVEVSEKLLRITNHASSLDEKALTSLAHDGFRAHESRGSTPGLGIGLSLVEKVAQIHDWKLTFSLSGGIFSASLLYGKNYRKN